MNEIEKLDEYLENKDFDNYYITLLKDSNHPVIAKRLNELLSKCVVDNIYDNKIEVLDNLNFENVSAKLEELNKLGYLDDGLLQLHYAVIRLYKENDYIYAKTVLINCNSNNHFVQFFLGLVFNLFRHVSREHDDHSISLYYFSLAALNGNEKARRIYTSKISEISFNEVVQQRRNDNIHISQLLLFENLYKKINKLSEELSEELSEIRKDIKNLREDFEYRPDYGKRFLEAKDSFDSKRYKLEN